jgi:hypothetical protein
MMHRYSGVDSRYAGVDNPAYQPSEDGGQFTKEYAMALERDGGGMLTACDVSEIPGEVSKFMDLALVVARLWGDVQEFEHELDGDEEPEAREFSRGLVEASEHLKALHDLLWRMAGEGSIDAVRKAMETFAQASDVVDDLADAGQQHQEGGAK